MGDDDTLPDDVVGNITAIDSESVKVGRILDGQQTSLITTH